MPATIKEYIVENDAAWEEVSKGVDSLVASHKGLTADVTYYIDLVTKLQNNPGPISQEDQVLLDAGMARAVTTRKNVTDAAAALTALDAKTELPVVEPPPTESEASGRR